MSADNGIYILETGVKLSKKEWRVAHLTAINNVSWNDLTKSLTDDEDIMIANARMMWNPSDVYPSKAAALVRASELYDEIMSDNFPVIEYGISFITIKRDW